jgi:ABC-type iron transport system FetAB permease component
MRTAFSQVATTENRVSGGLHSPVHILFLFVGCTTLFDHETVVVKLWLIAMAIVPVANPVDNNSCAIVPAKYQDRTLILKFSTKLNAITGLGNSHHVPVLTESNY